MATEHFCLRWNNHQSTLVSVFDNLLESGTLVDCTLAADGRYLKAHKVVLSACSPYLGMLLSQHYDKHPIIILKDVKFDELKAMLDYMYRGEVNISQEQLSTFLKAAETLQIKGLTDTGAEEGIQPNRPPSSNSTTSAPTEEPLSPGSAGPNSPNPKKRKRNKPSDDPPDEKPAGSDQNASVSSLSALKNVSFGSVKREPTERDGDGDGVMSVDDSNDSAMMARPGPSNGSGNNNKGSPWILSADSGGEEMQLTPGQDGDSQDKENPEIFEFQEETTEVKVEIHEESSEADPLSEDPLRMSKEPEELAPEIYKIINERSKGIIVPEIVADSSIGCSENRQRDFIQLIHPDKLMELTFPLNETIQTSEDISENDTRTDTLVVLSKGSTPQTPSVSGNLFNQPKSAEMPGSLKVVPVEINTTSENCQSHSHMKHYNSRSISVPVKTAPSGIVDRVAYKFTKIMPKMSQMQTAEAYVQNNENGVTVSNQFATSTTDVQSIMTTATATTQNIAAGQILLFATTAVSSSSQQTSHNLGLPVQISTGPVTHSASGALQPQWIVRPHLPSQPQTVNALNQPSPSFAMPQPVLVAPPAMKLVVSKPSERPNKVNIPGCCVSRFTVPTQKQGTRGGFRGGRSRAGRPRGSVSRGWRLVPFKTCWQNRLPSQHNTDLPITPDRGSTAGQAVTRTQLSQENAEFSTIRAKTFQDS